MVSFENILKNIEIISEIVLYFSFIFFSFLLLYYHDPFLRSGDTHILSIIAILFVFFVGDVIERPFGLYLALYFFAWHETLWYITAFSYGYVDLSRFLIAVPVLFILYLISYLRYEFIGYRLALLIPLFAYFFVWVNIFNFQVTVGITWQTYYHTQYYNDKFTNSLEIWSWWFPTLCLFVYYAYQSLKDFLTVSKLTQSCV
jgi:hypothetical protein